MIHIEGKRVVVMGLGRFGGGVGVTRWLASRGAAGVLVTDLDPAEKLGASLAAIGPLVERGGVELRLGEHNVSDFTTCDLVIANPAVPRPWENRFLRAAGAAQIPIVTEIGLVVERIPEECVTVGVTGTVGKSTTTAMIAGALTAGLGPARRVFMGGNIGGSLLEVVDGLGAWDVVVLELSSAMLYWLGQGGATVQGGAGFGWSPKVAVCTGFAPNHVDWHGSVEHYLGSKKAILAHQRATDTAVLGPGLADWAASARGKVVRVEGTEFPGALAAPGAHNRQNAAVALAACRGAAPEVETGKFVAALSGFEGLAHRLELAARVKAGGPHEGEVRCYNDSKSTTPEATLTAVAAVLEIPGVRRANVHLIAGGYDKGIDLSAIARLARGDGGEDPIAGLYTIGATGPTLDAASGGRSVPCGTVEAAVRRAAGRSRPGDVLVLSPGCASWDQFTNFEARGDLFRALVRDPATWGRTGEEVGR
jgi:UDP-N-acetylmuramoylalanine--D-glutamate ligase